MGWSTVHGEWSENRELKDTIYTASSLEFLDLSGCNESTTVRGDDKTLALLVAKSKNLRVLDLTMAKLPLLNNIANTLPWGHRLTSLNLSVVGNNQNDSRQACISGGHHIGRRRSMQTIGNVRMHIPGGSQDSYGMEKYHGILVPSTWNRHPSGTTFGRYIKLHQLGEFIQFMDAPHR